MYFLGYLLLHRTSANWYLSLPQHLVWLSSLLHLSYASCSRCRVSPLEKLPGTCQKYQRIHLVELLNCLLQRASQLGQTVKEYLLETNNKRVCKSRGPS